MGNNDAIGVSVGLKRFILAFERYKSAKNKHIKGIPPYLRIQGAKTLSGVNLLPPLSAFRLSAFDKAYG